MVSPFSLFHFYHCKRISRAAEVPLNSNYSGLARNPPGVLLQGRSVVVEHRFEARRISVALDRRFLARLADHLLLLVRHLDVERTEVLLDTVQLRTPRDGEDVVTLRHQPRERQLAGRDALRLRDRGDFVDKLEVLGEVLRTEAGHDAPHVRGLEVIGRAVCAREHAPPDRRVCDNGDAELARGLQHVDLGRLDIEREGRVLDLDGGDGVDGVRTTQRSGTALAQAEVFDLAFVLELHHLLDGLLDGGLAIEAVAVVEVDGIDAEVLQRQLARLACLLRRAIDVDSTLAVEDVRELCREEDVLALLRVALEPLADQFFGVGVQIG